MLLSVCHGFIDESRIGVLLGGFLDAFCFDDDATFFFVVLSLLLFLMMMMSTLTRYLAGVTLVEAAGFLLPLRISLL